MGRRKGRCPLTPAGTPSLHPARGNRPLTPFRDCIGHTSMLLPRVYPQDTHTFPCFPTCSKKQSTSEKKSPCNPNDKPSRRCNNLETHPAHRRNASHQQYAADGRFRGGRAVESSRSDGSLGDCRSDGSTDRDTRARTANGTIGGCADCDPRSRKSDGSADRDTRSRKSDG